jgi:hypothetical protein
MRPRGNVSSTWSRMRLAGASTRGSLSLPSRGDLMDYETFEDVATSLPRLIDEVYDRGRLHRVRG